MRTDMPSPRQIEILQLLAEGLSTGEIAQRLYLWPHTVKTMRETALQRLGGGTPQRPSPSRFGVG
jgi:DNA-binding NarL/FixJ family response regulator